MAKLLWLGLLAVGIAAAVYAKQCWDSHDDDQGGYA